MRKPDGKVVDGMLSIVLAGGYATRLWPITKDLPKPLLPLGRRAIIDHVIEKVSGIPEIETIVVSVNKKFETEFKAWKERKKYKKIVLNVEGSTREEEKMGATRATEELIRRYEADEYLILAGDNVFSFNLDPIINLYKRVKTSVIALYDVGDVRLASRYANVEVDEEGRVIKMVEKPHNPATSLISTGIYVVPRSHLLRITEYLREGGSPDAPGYFFSWLASREPVYTYTFDGYWFDIGSADTYLEAFKRVVTGSYVSPNARVEERAELRHPVIVERGCLITSGSEIGPYVYLGPGTTVKSSTLRDCVALGEDMLVSATVEKSIIGKKTVLKQIQITDSLLGDYTRVLGF